MVESVAAAGMRDGRARRPGERLAGGGRARTGRPLRRQDADLPGALVWSGPQRRQESPAGCGLVTEQVTLKVRYVGVFNTAPLRLDGADSGGTLSQPCSRIGLFLRATHRTNSPLGWQSRG